MTTDGSTSAATLTRPKRECRNPACFSWAQECDDEMCESCGWQLALTTDDDVALKMPNGEWALADVQDVLSTGSEMKIKAWALRLCVKARSHRGVDDPSLKCCCGDGFATTAHLPDELSDGRCRYCDGTGVITLDIARRQCAMQHGDQT
jgi:hypothetical protein